MSAKRAAAKSTDGVALVEKKCLSILSVFDDTTPDPSQDSLEDQLYIAWFPRFLAHEQGCNVDEDPIFGPWDELDEAAAVHWRGAGKGAKRSKSGGAGAAPDRLGRR